MQPVAARTALIDLEYLDEPGHIATCLLETGDGLALVDPGPSTTLPRLDEALRGYGATIEDVRVLLITHIHLDHAGATGLLLRHQPRLRVYVHERGAPHLADPGKLLRSAAMIYGDQMERLWGEVVPVPKDRIQPLSGGETLRFGDRQVEVAYTPGHAWHHVSYLDGDHGIAFTGDVVGEQLPGSTHPVPVTPPPDIDVEEMLASGERILAWRPTRLFVTHFGPVEDPPAYIAEHAARLSDWSERVRASLDLPGTDEHRADAFAEEVYPGMRALLPPAAQPFLRREVLAGNWVGLARYWRKKQEAAGPS